MLEIRKTAVSFDERPGKYGRVSSRTLTRKNHSYLKKCIYDRILHSQQGKLKSHLDSANPVEGFKRSNVI